MNKKSKIYVAGHLGLVGSAIWKNLTNKGYTNLIGRTKEELNLLDQTAVEQFFEIEKPEYVVLAAAKVGGILANNIYRADFIFENLQIQNNIIHQSYKHGIKKLLFLGSTCIYPKTAPQPMPEHCLLTGELEYTNEPYAIAKIAGLKMCESYNIQYGTDFIAVMPTNLYGPNDNFNLETSHVLPALMRKIHLGKCLLNNDWANVRRDFEKRPVENTNGTADKKVIVKLLEKYGISKNSEGQISISLWGTGTPMREFLWSEDMADACVFLLENISFNDLKSNYGNEIKNTHINIGTGEEISISKLSEYISKAIGYSGNIVFDSTKPDGTLRKLTDPSKLHQLGWNHKVGIHEGIEKLYTWYLNN